MIIIDRITDGEAQTLALAEEFARTLKGGEFIAMKGDLGAGKTVFVRGLASVLAPEGAVSSPSYAIVHEYGGPYNLCHFDMYRINGEDDLYSIGFFDYDGCIMAVEWSEKIEELLPSPRFEVQILKVDEVKRRIVIEEIK
ncbi:MAG: tRNA (adenosine(37)-N6)-threonylcarbamoyltransferase complex ATPase subunit type 1 TsaE [Clostridia bacterium]|nr:tRNA (adenosine(37)-N6)-threonylcarbamoyltransferase complex ATPase subunit type 1 TsaE [Clostridia bacterium]